MTKKTAYRGHPKQFIAPVRARNILSGHAPGICGTREKRNVVKNNSTAGTTKNPGPNGAEYYARIKGAKK